ncbi:MAG: hypothetical protein OZ921_17470 [Sorangiineae bacterium]|nr:hypothetical protein [Polyangiaceae bacterium]MEB2324308.1 hypothetical protein [Sorangiineae bacterium]
MREKNPLRYLLSAALLALTALGLLNVFGDNAEVVAQAEALTCESPPCGATLTQLSRSPISQSFRFQVGGKHPGEVAVECHRSYYFVGQYQCAKR